MNREKTMRYVELDAERMIRLGAISRTLRPARLWVSLYRLTIVALFIAFFLVLQVLKKNQPILHFIAFAGFLLLYLPLIYFRNSAIRTMRAYRDAFLQSYGPFVLGTIFTNLQIRQGSGVSWETISRTNMMFPGSFLESQSIIRGRYRGIPFEQSAIQTETRASTFLEKLNRNHSRDMTVFRGLWTVVSLNGSYQPELQIIERGFRNKRNRLSLLARYTVGHRYFPKSPGFNFRFRVYAPDREDADHILTPEPLKQIRDMAAQTRGRLMLCFVNGALHIVVQRRRGAFSPPSVFLPFREERAIALIQREIAPFTRLIDALNPDGKLFRHEEIQLPAKPAEKILWLD